MKNTILYHRLLFSVIFILSLYSLKAIVPYKNTQLSFEERTADLLSRLTLEEKVQLMRYDSPEIKRLGIPAYNWWNECLHGVGRSGLATVFPQAIGMAAMWDTDQMYRIANAISDEARAKNNDYVSKGKREIYEGLTFWTPNINIFRDPRWGRGMETYGEDPYLTAEMAIPFIKGLQGDDPKYFKLIATSKHFAVHSGPESTRHSFDVWPNDYDMAETYLPHFKRTVQEANVYSVMCAYQRYKGTPCCGNKYLEDLVRNKWGFKGYIVSDCGAIRDFYEKNAHAVVATPEEAAAMAVKAGTDLNCGNTYYPYLITAVEKGLISEKEIDISASRLILARMKLGMFDSPELVKYKQIPISKLNSKANKALALESARKSIVLLKNENNLLPLSKNVKKVAVIGPNANENTVLLGNYNGYPEFSSTPYLGIKGKLPDSEVKYAQGCRLVDGFPFLSAVPGEVLFTDKSKKQKGLRAEYYANSILTGKPKHTRVDADINFEWRNKSPFSDMDYTNFSVRWKGVIIPKETGDYQLGGEGLSGFRLFVDGKEFLYYKNNKHHAQRLFKSIKLTTGKAYDIVLEYHQENNEFSIMRLLWDAPNTNMKNEAIELAKNSDIVVLCMGLSPLLEGEEMKVNVDGFFGGDRKDISLPQTQSDLINSIHELGKPTVLVFMNGSAIAFNQEKETIPAIIEAWYPGQAGGKAIADVIFGDYNPSGRLPVTFYKNTNQIPAFDNYDMTGKTYRYFKGEPLFEFGYGLSYSNFEYSIKKVSSEIKTNENIVVQVEIFNSGSRDGEEVAQLYASLPENSLKKEIRSLEGFKRIYLKKGERKIVEFVLKPNQFAARDINNVAFVSSGKVELSIGGKQPDSNAITSKNVVQTFVNVTGDKFYINE
ncbi:MAG: glycoside hydrolase family 3 C-terminal domain-containing protein [Paludibacteraceae bacterium]